jgi:uncharacterized protein YdiU (UPF0061 family)
MAAITFKFDNRALRALPVESEARNFVRQVSNACFSRVRPTPVTNPQLIAYSPACVRLIGIQPEVIEANRDYAANVFAGNIVPDGADPAAQCYCGHQFGSFAGQLGDGAAILIGEVVGELGRYELQIKGAGPTPYSRTADGRKVLRSSLREFVCSEAMWGLGIPSTRAATLVTSDTTVERDPMYTGRIINERCSIVSRVAETFIRFGSFEIALVEGHNSDRHGPSPGNTPLIRTLFDFVATQYYAAVPADPNSSPFRLRDDQRVEAVRSILTEITRRTACLVAAWQCVGFVHGVLNTDNMSITGLTIDYGPYAFMDYFDMDMIPNSSDDGGLYRYANQPARCKWNCLRLAEAWAYVEDGGDEREALAASLRQIVEERFTPAFDAEMDTIMTKKLGLPPGADAREWRQRWFKALAESSADMTGSYLALESFVAALAGGASVTAATETALTQFGKLHMSLDSAVNRLKRKAFASRSHIKPEQLIALMKMCDEEPDRISMMFGADPAAFKAQLEGERHKLEISQRCKQEAGALGALSTTEYAERCIRVWAEFLHEYAELLAASGDGSADVSQRALSSMRHSNPRFVLRQWVAQACINEAEAGRYKLTQQLVERLLNPYAEHPLDTEGFSQPPEGAFEICVSCSS